eukprot:42223_1
MDLINMLLTDKPPVPNAKAPSKPNNIYAKFAADLSKDEDETSSKSAEFEESKSPETSQSILSPRSPLTHNGTHHPDEDIDHNRNANDEAAMIELHNTLERLSAQESDLKHKANHVGQWYHLHKNALQTTAQTKQKLIHIVNDPSKRDAHQTLLMRSNINQLEQTLNQIASHEKQYQSQESIRKENDFSQTICELQNKYDALRAKYNQQTTELQQLSAKYHDTKLELKSLTQSYKSSMESMESKHKAYIEKLTSENDNLFKTHKQQQQKSITAAVHALKIQKQKELQIALDACKAMEHKWIEKETEIAEYREREEAHNAMMVMWRKEKGKKNAKIDELSKTIEELNEKIKMLERQHERLQETAALHSVQMAQKEQMLGELQEKCKGKCQEIERVRGLKNLSDAKLKVAVKEIIKLREEINAKEAHKTVLLTNLSEMETDTNKNITQLKSNVERLEHEMEMLRYEFGHKFKIFSERLNEAQSKLESFSVTIKNFSGNELKQSFDTELEARVKSNQELPMWKENINKQLQKTTHQIAVRNMNGKDNNYVKESERHIAHIKLTGLQILHEYTSLLIRYNHLYILHNGNGNNNNNRTLFRRKTFSR